jgi:hypothetical protein
MNLTEKSLLIGICNWITNQSEYKKIDITDPGSIFYTVSVQQYGKLIMRFVCDEVEKSKRGETTIFDVIGHCDNGQLKEFADMVSNDNFAYLKDADTLLNDFKTKYDKI